MNAALLVFAPFVFSGGDVGDLGRTLADWSGRPTVALVQSDARLAKFDIQMLLDEVGDGKHLTRLLDVKARTKAVVRNDAISLSSGAWDDETTLDRVVLGQKPRFAPKLVRPDPKWLQDGRVTVRLKPGEAIRLGDLDRLEWAHPLSVHWFLADLWIVPTARGASQETFLRAVAEASAGALERSDREWKLGFDAKSFRPRALATLARRSPEGDTPLLGYLQREIAQEAWARATDAAINDLYAAPNQYGGWTVVPRGRMSVLAGQYLAAQRAFVTSPPPGLRQVAGVVGSLIDDVTFERPVKVGLGQNLSAPVSFPRRSGGTILL